MPLLRKRLFQENLEQITSIYLLWDEYEWRSLEPELIQIVWFAVKTASLHYLI
jgi:hypothetical protein